MDPTDESAVADRVRSQRAGRESLESTTVVLEKRLHSNVTVAMETTPSAVFREYGIAPHYEVLFDPDGIGRLVEELQSARETLRSRGELTDHKDSHVREHVLLLEFARTNGYGVGYP